MLARASKVTFLKFLAETRAFMTTATSRPLFYTWRGYRCAYGRYNSDGSGSPLVLVHPIGVGLGREFWQRFVGEWPGEHPIYAPDLLGCGQSDLPRAAYRPEDWARQLQYFIAEEVDRPPILIVQGGCLPISLALLQLGATVELRGLILSGPPAGSVISQPTAAWQQRLAWNLFDSPLGWAFYQYARSRRFLRSFSQRQLFARHEDVDAQWLDTLIAGARPLATRHAVFSFLAGYWRQDWREAIAAISVPTLVLMGEQASSISRSSKPPESPARRLQQYCDWLPKGRGALLPGRNVLPYEEPAAFATACYEFVRSLNGD